MLRYIIIFFIVYFVFKLLKKLLFVGWQEKRQIYKNQTAATTGEDLVEDPNCHTYIPVSSAYKAIHEGKTLYFCSKKCLKEYTVNQKKEV